MDKRKYSQQLRRRFIPAQAGRIIIIHIKINIKIGSSLHRQGVCVVSQETAAKIYPCVDGHCDRCGSSAVRRYQYFSVLLQFLYTSKREHFFDGDLISYPHVVPSVRLGFYILPALGPSGQLYAITRL